MTDEGIKHLHKSQILRRSGTSEQIPRSQQWVIAEIAKPSM